jgi:hypothetical protein
MYIFGHFSVLKLNSIGCPKTKKSTGAKIFYFFSPVENTTIHLIINELIDFRKNYFFLNT